MLNFNTPVKDLTSVGKTTASRLQKIGINTANDLLWNIPRQHEDLSEVTLIESLEPGHKVCIKAKVEMIQTKRSPRKRMYITEGLVSDNSGQMKIIWFNQPYISKTLHTGDEVYFAGEIQNNNLLEIQLTNPTYEKVSNNTTHTARIVPLYHLTAGLTQKQLRFLIKQVLPLAQRTIDYLPDFIKTEYNLIDLPQALQDIHFPKKLKDFDQARDRLKFDELLLIMITVLDSKNKLKDNKAPSINFQEKVIKEFVAHLPFELTSDQKKAAWEILRDLEKTKPMNRLLEGDVGSGKTVVAGLALLNTAAKNLQAALLAPTEILAQQHFITFTKLFANEPIPMALFTRTDKKIITSPDKACPELVEGGGSRGVENISKKELIAKIKTNEIKLVIGTHALLQESVEFSDLAFIVIDEQHRFGVSQRQKLKDATPDLIPHFLSMTATPIPRSLALTLYGDLDISLIKEKPANRKPINTKLITTSERQSAYDFIRDEVKQNNQIFVICPLIDESDKLGVKSVTQEYENLSTNIFPDLTIGLVHGKLKKDAKEQVMDDFRKNKINILVATAVVEVGVDIPNATIMMIEGADRFGLAQLHQFRGRVGRSSKQSYCLLFTESNSPQTLERLNALVKSNNGFELAEQDLKFRGPGDIYGYKQSGLPELKIASLGDLELMKKTKEAAQKLLNNYPNLNGLDALQNKLKLTQAPIHFE